MWYGNAIALTMVSALVAEPALAQGGAQQPQYGPASEYNETAPNSPHHARGWVVDQYDIHNFSGPRAEVQLDWSSLTGSVAGGYGGYCGGYACGGGSQQLSSNFNIGGEIGYDIPISHNVTVGPYGSYTTKLTTASGCLSCGGDNYAAGIRAGLMVAPKFMVYGKIGYSGLKSNINYLYTDNHGATVAANTNFRYSGAEFGVGLDYRVSKKSYVGLEFKDATYGNGDPYYYGSNRTDLALKIGTHF